MELNLERFEDLCVVGRKENKWVARGGTAFDASVDLSKGLLVNCLWLLSRDQMLIRCISSKQELLTGSCLFTDLWLAVLKGRQTNLKLLSFLLKAY